jgi:hypothetical protein
MSKYKCKHHWNYRVVTKLIGEDRIFSVVEVYYNSENKPDSYIDSKNVLNNYESKKALKWSYNKIKEAFNKHILDLDNWPHNYK